ncbi:sedoheptulose-1,7-bisphosphatase [Nemania sp. FL0916]|nr:sedoheptulose-1,7-bisphosphatase [Nemania sp. FL0916]
MTPPSSLSLLLGDATGSAYPSLTTSVLPSLLRAIARTAGSLRGAQRVESAGSDNVFGDAQLNVDVLAEGHFREEIAGCGAIVAASSEEDPVETSSSSARKSKSGKEGEDEGGKREGGEKEEDEEDVYAIAFDPLDGSSIIAPNWAVGSIVGIWAGKTAINQDPRKRQIAAILAVHGPRTTAVIAVRVPGREDQAVCVEVHIDPENPDADAIVVRPALRLEDVTTTGTGAGGVEGGKVRTRYFAPANLRSAAEDPRYMSLITRFITQRYTLRYSGGLVPDIIHALVKGHGVYVSPVTERSTAKLRRAFELLPVALVVECAGGRAVDPVTGRDVLDTMLRGLDEKGGLVCGNRGEVEGVVEVLLG